MVRNQLSTLPFAKEGEVLENAVSIIDGSWPGSSDARDEFIEKSFAEILDVSEAKSKLGPLTSVDDEDKEKEIAERFEYVFENLLEYFGNSFIKQKISDSLNIEGSIVAPLLTKILLQVTAKTILETINDGNLLKKQIDEETDEEIYEFEITPTNFPQIFTAFALLHKIALIVSKLKITGSELEWLLEYSQSFGWLDLSVLPTDQNLSAVSFDEWEKLIDGWQLKSVLQKSGGSLLDFLETIILQQSMSENEVQESLSDFTGWEKNEIKELANAFNLGTFTTTSLF